MLVTVPDRNGTGPNGHIEYTIQLQHIPIVFTVGVAIVPGTSFWQT